LEGKNGHGLTARQQQAEHESDLAPLNESPRRGEHGHSSDAAEPDGVDGALTSSVGCSPRATPGYRSLLPNGPCPDRESGARMEEGEGLGSPHNSPLPAERICV
jgi:hypothetical protein